MPAEREDRVDGPLDEEGRFHERSGSVYAWCGCRDQVTGRRLGSRCPRRGQRGHASWYLSLEMPAGADGGCRRVRRGGYPTREAARRALSLLVMPVPGGRDNAPVTVGQWLQRWLGQRAADRVLSLELARGRQPRG